MRNPNEIISVEKEKRSSEIHNERQKLKKLIIVIPVLIAVVTGLISLCVTKFAMNYAESETRSTQIEVLAVEVNELNAKILELETERSKLEERLRYLNLDGEALDKKTAVAKEIEKLNNQIAEIEAKMKEKQDELNKELE